MRIVWKDSVSPRGSFKPIKYRRHVISGYNGGWITNIPGDNNIYKNNYCAMNAIDEYLGGTSQRGDRSEKRKSFGIQIVGKKDDETA